MLHRKGVSSYTCDIYGFLEGVGVSAKLMPDFGVSSKEEKKEGKYLVVVGVGQ
jgi:hypothetical protein